MPAEQLDIDDKRFRIRPYQQIMASCSGAIVTALTMTPLDVVKIRLQSQQKALLSNRCFLYCNGLMDHICHCVNGQLNVWVNKKPVGEFTSTLDAFSKIIRHEGPLSLWSGLPPTLVMAIPSTIIYFVSYEQLRNFFGDNYKEFTGEPTYPVYASLFAGAIARIGTVTFVSPLELIRTKMQSKLLSYKEVLTACKSLYQAKGIRGFWLGWGPSLMRDVPFSSIYWTSYEALKRYSNQGEQPSLTFSFSAGAAAGSLASLVTLPFDVVKTHRQIELGESDFAESNKKLSTTPQVMRRIYNSQGISGLFAGVIPRLIKVAPACAIMISSYEYGKDYFRHRNKETYERSHKSW